MNEDQHDDTPKDNANDRALMAYLDDILGDPSPGKTRTSSNRQEQSRQEISARNDRNDRNEKVTPLEIARNRNTQTDNPPALLKSESKQNVTLPFRTAEKPKVLSSLNLLNLKTAPDPEPVKPKPELVTVKPVPAPVETPPPEKPQVIEAPAAKMPLPDVVDSPAIEVVDDALSATPLERLPETKTRQDSERPAWANERFECLIFKVAGLKLAVPLITLGAIHQIDRKFNALPHQSDWFIGILQTSAAGNIKVLDTALCVMPERYDPASRDSLAYVITIHGYQWGLACHELEKSITLEPHQVKWRTQRGKRPWLAGTVIDHMCALIDTDGFHDVIKKAEQSV